MNKEGILSRVKSSVRGETPYTVKEVNFDVINVDKNENPNDVPADLKREILDFAMERSWSRYPPVIAKKLYDSVAEYAGWPSEGVVAGNGSDELIFMLLFSFLKPGMKLVTATPTFLMYRHVAALIGAEMVEVPLTEDYDYDCDSLETAFLDGGDMLIICSPNNPTGTLFPIDRLERILKKSDAPVIVDEAYYEFSKVTALDLIKKYENLIILRTFSKAFSLAGLRVGYSLMSPDLAIEIGKVKIPFNLDIFSVKAACTMLENSDRMTAVVSDILRERTRLSEAMSAIPGVKIFPSHANFILFKTPHESKKIYDAILCDGILVRDYSENPLLTNTLRVTVSSVSDNDLFIASLERVMNKFAVSE